MEWVRINDGFILLMVWIILFPACKSGKPSASHDILLVKLEAEADSLLLHPAIDAVSMACIYQGRVYKIHKGRLPNGKPPGKHTQYEIASLTKTFTGTLIAGAIVDGKIGLDDDIRPYLKDSFPNLAFDGQPVRFRNLLTHQSGLPHMFPDQKDLFTNPDWDKLPFEINKLQGGMSRESFLQHLHKVHLDTVPGYKLSYSNAGANLLGYILEEIYHESYEDLLDKRILEPLRMEQTELGSWEAEKNYLAEGQNSNRVPMPFMARKEMNAEGGIVSNLDDMIRYMKFQLDTTNPVVKTSHQDLWNGKYGDYGAGFFWQIYRNGDRPDRIFQNGGSFGTSCWLTLVPEKNSAVFIITNTAGPDIHQKLYQSADRLLEGTN